LEVSIHAPARGATDV